MRFFHAPVNAFPILAAALLFAACSESDSNNGGADAGASNVSFAPDVISDELATAEDVAAVFDVLVNDIPRTVAINPGSLVIMAGPAHGTLFLESNGLITYTPAADYNGPDAFTYKVANVNGFADANYSEVATASITVTEVNDAPVISGAPQFSVAEIGCAETVVGVANQAIINLEQYAEDKDFDLTAADFTGATVDVVDEPDNGTATVDAFTGIITYKPNTGFFGSDTFSVTLTTATTSLSVSEATWIVVDVVENISPVVSDSSVSATEGATEWFAVSAIDSDGILPLEGATAPITIVTPPMDDFGNIMGAVTVANPAGVWGIQYSPSDTCGEADDFMGNVTFTYKVTDDDCDDSNVGTMTLMVMNTPDGPEGGPDAFDVQKNVPTALSVLDNDVPGGGWDTNQDCVDDSWEPQEQLDPTAIEIVQAPSNGSVLIQGNGTVVYVSNQGYVGADQFSYTCRDEAGDTSNVATVSIDVKDGNTPPTAVNDDISVDEDGSVTFSPLGNDFDLDSEPQLDGAAIRILHQAGHGEAVANLDGTITYTPDSNRCGADIFYYVVEDTGYTDGGGLAYDPASSNAAAVEVTINEVNDAPESTSGTESEDFLALKNPPEGTQESFSLSLSEGAHPGGEDINTGETDCGDALQRYEILVGAANGSIVLDEHTGEVIYTPNPNFGDDPTNSSAGTSGVPGFELTDFEDDTFTYRVMDLRNEWSAPVVASVRVFDRRTAPFAGADAATLAEDSSTDVDVTANDGDQDRDAGAIPPAVDPVSQFYTGLDKATLEIVQGPANGQAEIVDLDGDPATVDPGIRYTPNQDFFGEDSVLYRIAENREDPFDLTEELWWSDAQGQDPTELLLTVTSVNDDPVGEGDDLFVDERGCVTAAVNFVEFDMADYMTDIDSDIVFSQVLNYSFSTPAFGVLSFQGGANGTVRYTPTIGEHGVDNFTVVVTDEDGGASNEVPFVVYIKQNQAPEAEVSFAFSVNENGCDGSTGNFVFFNINNQIGGAFNDADGSISISTKVLVQAPQNGFMTEFANGWRYTPNPHFTGTDYYSFVLFDDDCESTDEVRVDIDVSPNQAPVAQGASGEINEGESFAQTIATFVTATGAVVPAGTLVETLVGDPDGTIDLASLAITTEPDFGEVEIFTAVDPEDASNTLLRIGWTPTNECQDPDWWGSVVIGYTIDDDDCATTNEAFVDVTVNPVNDPPVLFNDEVQTFQGVPVDFDLFSNDVLGGGISDDGQCQTQDRDDADAGDNWNEDSFQVSGATVIDDSGDVQTFLLNQGDAFLEVNKLTGAATVYPGPTNLADGSDPTSLSYDPRTQCFVGIVTFTYTRSDIGVNGDPLAPVDPAYVTIEFLADDNDCPLALDFVHETWKNIAAGEPERIIDLNAPNTDGVDDTIDWSTFTVLGETSHESSAAGFQHDGAGFVTYMPTANFVGTDSFVYAVADSAGQWTVATVTINVNDRNTPPIALDDGDSSGDSTGSGISPSLDTLGGVATLHIPVLTGAFGNEADYDWDAVSGQFDLDPDGILIDEDAEPENGTAVPLNDGSGMIAYTPVLGFVGTDSFRYTVADTGYDNGTDQWGPARSNAAWVYVYVYDSTTTLVVGGPSAAERGAKTSKASALRPTVGSQGGELSTEADRRPTKSVSREVVLPKGVTIAQVLPLWTQEARESIAVGAGALLSVDEDRFGDFAGLSLTTRRGSRTVLSADAVAGEVGGLWVTPGARLAVVRGELAMVGQSALYALDVETGKALPMLANLERGEQVVEFAVSPDMRWVAYLVQDGEHRALRVASL